VILDVILAATRDGIARGSLDGEPAVERVVAETRVHCLAADPLEPSVVYAGTEAGDVLCSPDRGRTWDCAGRIARRPIRSLAASPHERGVLYAGVRPAAHFRSHDGGASWSELPAFRRKQALEDELSRVGVLHALMVPNGSEVRNTVAQAVSAQAGAGSKRSFSRRCGTRVG